MSQSINVFRVGIDAWVKKAQAGINDAIVLAATNLVSNIVKGTPVGDPSTWAKSPPDDYIAGTARGNWIASINGYTASFNELGYTRSEEEVISDAVAMIESSIGQTFYLTNSAPYINRLEYEAWSNQAPAGMVRLNVSQFNTLMDNAVKTLDLN